MTGATGSTGATGTTGSSGTLGGTGNGPAIAGSVLAGGAPLAGAQVELFAAGTAGNGSAPTQLLAAALTTDTNGVFNVAAGTYECPAPGATVYLVSRGGQIGTQAANPAVAFITVTGRCDGAGLPGTYVLNELTTVATASVLRPFMAAGALLGASATNASGLALGVAELDIIINPANGSAPGLNFPANGTAPTLKLHTLANVLHGCATAAGAGSSACTSLFTLTTANGVPPTNTLDAALNIANQAGTNVASLYALANQTQAYMPGLNGVPSDWIIAVPYTGGGMNGPTALSIDSTGKVWVANYFGVASLFGNNGAPVLAAGITGSGLGESYGGAVDPQDRMWVTNEQTDSSVNNGYGSVTVLNDAGPALSGNSQFSSGGLSFPIAVAFDRSGLAWVVDYGNAHVTLLDSNGVPQSGASGYTSDQFEFPVAVAVDSLGNGWVANQSGSTVSRVSRDGATVTSYVVGNGPSAVAVDGGNAVWVANYFDDSIGLVSATGQVVSSGGFTGGGLNHPTGIAVDGAGTAWVANYRGAGISSLAGTGAPVPGAPLSPATGWGADQQLTSTLR